VSELCGACAGEGRGVMWRCVYAGVNVCGRKCVYVYMNVNVNVYAHASVCVCMLCGCAQLLVLCVLRSLCWGRAAL
jgi:hypothetical protein